MATPEADLTSPKVETAEDLPVIAVQDQSQRADKFLSSVENHLIGHESAEALGWLDDIDKIRAAPKHSRTVIGVVGSTGAGKSALINALLDEECVIPTNCVRACTAVVTEIQQNTSDVPYRAEIEFVSRQQWQSELDVLLGDFMVDNKILRDVAFADSEAGVSYSKVRSVYSDFTRERIQASTREDFMAHPSLAYLGTTEVVESSDALTFRNKLQVFVDSREKSSNRSRASKKVDTAVEFWPLIKVVRIYLKARILDTGVVLVDLPGVHDSNAARAAVAQTYLKQCSHLIIVAPITRAVDDKSAKTLLDQSFKQQLKLDGNFDNIIFVCSKTDDISINETRRNLDMEPKLELFLQEKAALKDRQLQTKQEYTMIGSMIDSANEEMHDIDEQLEEYEKSLKHTNRGGTPSDETASSQQIKRKRSESTFGSRKKANCGDPSDMDSEQEYGEAVSQYNQPNILESQAQGIDAQRNYTREQIDGLKQQKSTLRRRARGLQQKQNDLNNKVQSVKSQLRLTNAQIARECIAARNEYSCAAIKEDFALGVREIDQNLAAEGDPENFDPHEELRDYEEVANRLPVFCVSSRAYQQVNGRLHDEKVPAGFQSAADTQIPRLQNHCRGLATAGYEASFASHFSKVIALCTSIKIWAFEDEKQRVLTEDELSFMENALRAELILFSSALCRLSKATIDFVTGDINKYICSSFQKASEKAQQRAKDTAAKWGSPVNRGNPAEGGLACGTYRAVTKRKGYFPKVGIVHDFNKDLADPLVNHILHGWEKVFTQLVPAAVEKGLQQFEEVISEFQEKLPRTFRRYGITGASVKLLEEQYGVHAQNLRDAVAGASQTLKAKSKDINRQFTPAIADEMDHIYAECCEQSGKGCFMRMKTKMLNGVEQISQAMFQDCINHVEKQLAKMVKAVDKELRAKITDTTDWVERDCLQLVANQSKRVFGQQRILRRALQSSIDEFESIKEEPTSMEPDSRKSSCQTEVKTGETFEAKPLATPVTEMGRIPTEVRDVKPEPAESGEVGLLGGDQRMSVAEDDGTGAKEVKDEAGSMERDEVTGPQDYKAEDAEKEEVPEPQGCETEV